MMRLYPALLLSLLFVLPAAQAEDLVRLGNLKFAHYGAVSYMKEIAGKYNLKIEERMFAKGPEIMPAIVAGEIDAAASAADGAISARANGVPIYIVAGFAKGGARLVARADLAIKTVKELNANREGSLLDFIADFCQRFDGYCADYETLLTDNRIWKQRLVDIGIVTPERALQLGFTGPMLRGSGIDAGANFPPLAQSYPTFITAQKDAEMWGRCVINLWLTEDYDAARIRAAAAIIGEIMSDNSDSGDQEP